MRLTVGPLPPAVYWRRRAVVLGSAILVIILLAYSCGGSGDGDSKARNTGATSSPAASAAASSGAPPPPSPTPSQPVVQTAAPTAPAADPNLCTDSEMSVTPAPASQQVPRGATLQIVLKIKNVSNRTCKRDAGADLQELYIVARGGVKKVWSSDDCGGPRGNDMESFPPNIEHTYTVSWNGLATTNCKDRPVPEAGEYQLYGRLGTKRSAPVTLTLT